MTRLPPIWAKVSPCTPTIPPALRFFRTLALLATVWSALAAGLRAANWSEHVGLQLYSLRNADKSTVVKIELAQSYGITEVETAGTWGLGAAEFAAALREHHLRPVSAHYGYEQLEKDVGAVIAEAKALGVEYVIVPSMPSKDGVFDANAVIANFNTWGQALHAAGLKFGYHPHGFEFVPLADGRTRFDLVMTGTDPRFVCFEMDVFWILHAGVDPVALLKKYPSRWQLMHVKDMRKGAPTGFHNGSAPTTDKAIVGQGLINWPELLAVADQAGVKHYFIEDETAAPRENIATSLAYLRTLKP